MNKYPYDEEEEHSGGDVIQKTVKWGKAKYYLFMTGEWDCLKCRKVDVRFQGTPYSSSRDARCASMGSSNAVKPPAEVRLNVGPWHPSIESGTRVYYGTYL